MPHRSVGRYPPQDEPCVELDSDGPHTDIIEEARRLTTAAQRDGIALKLMGGVGIYFHSPTARKAPLGRAYRDLDFVGLSSRRAEIHSFFARCGYELDRPFNTLQGLRRLRFLDSEHHREIDLFLDEFRMCHRLDLRARLSLSGEGLAPADLLLTKMQIVELNAKDLTDVAALLLDHPVGDGDGEMINATYIAALAARDWGLYRTLQLNIDRLQRVLTELPLPADLALSRLHALWQAVHAYPKSSVWRLRARIGDRLRWYDLPEEDDPAM